MAKGDHIYIHKGLITHHGIDCGDGIVINYTGKENGGKITETSYTYFRQGQYVYVKSYPYKYSADEIVRRAKKRLHEPNYNLILNNCEHFATDCTTGEPDSQQVGNGVSAAGAGLAAAAGLAAVETTVPAAGLLGVMGLTTTAALPVAAVLGGAGLAAVAVFGIFKGLSELDDQEY